jgi:hypothetical protein
VLILPRRKAFEALAHGCLKNLKLPVFRERRSFLLGHPFSSAGMAQRAKEVETEYWLQASHAPARVRFFISLFLGQPFRSAR